MGEEAGEPSISTFLKKRVNEEDVEELKQLQSARASNNFELQMKYGGKLPKALGPLPTLRFGLLLQLLSEDFSSVRKERRRCEQE